MGSPIPGASGPLGARPMNQVMTLTPRRVSWRIGPRLHRRTSWGSPCDSGCRRYRVLRVRAITDGRLVRRVRGVCPSASSRDTTSR